MRDGEREPDHAERVVLGTWRPIGCGDRLYVESREALEPELVDKLEDLAKRMRDLVRGKRVRFMDVGPYELRRGDGPRRGLSPRRLPGSTPP